MWAATLTDVFVRVLQSSLWKPKSDQEIKYILGTPTFEGRVQESNPVETPGFWAEGRPGHRGLPPRHEEPSGPPTTSLLLLRHRPFLARLPQPAVSRGLAPSRTRPS